MADQAPLGTSSSAQSCTDTNSYNPYNSLSIGVCILILQVKKLKVKEPKLSLSKITRPVSDHIRAWLWVCLPRRPSPSACLARVPLSNQETEGHSGSDS